MFDSWDGHGQGKGWQPGVNESWPSGGNEGWQSGGGEWPSGGCGGWQSGDAGGCGWPSGDGGWQSGDGSDDGAMKGCGMPDDKGGKGGKGKGNSKRRRYDENGDKIANKRANQGKKGAAARIAGGEPFYHGQVRSYMVEKKHGYICCEQVFGMCGQDVYVYQDVLERSKAGPAAPGDTVAFFLHWSSRGQPQASSPLIRLSGPDAAYALRGTFKAGRDSDKGFGFIECEETKDFFGRDVYVSRDIASNLVPGQQVAFSVYLNRDGMPNVHALEPCDEDWQPMRGDISVSSEVFVSGGADRGKGKRLWGSGGGCKGDFGTCKGDFSGCKGDFGGCKGDFRGCKGDFGGCKGDFGGCKGDFGGFKGDFGSFKGEFGGCKGDFGGCKGDFGGCQGDFGGCKGDFGACEGDFGGCKGDFGGCKGDFGGCKGDFGGCKGDFGGCKGDFGGCKGDFGGCKGDFGGCKGDFGGCKGDFGGCKGGYGGCQGDLGAWEADPGGWGAWGSGGDGWGPDPQGFMAMGGMDGAKGSKGGGKAKGCKGWSGGGKPGPQGPGKPVSTGVAYTGVVKSFNESNFYGFIACDDVSAEYGCDVFVHGKELRGLPVGSMVQFEVRLSSKGQPQAQHVRPVDEEAAAAAMQAKSAWTGPIRPAAEGEEEPAGDGAAGGPPDAFEGTGPPLWGSLAGPPSARGLVRGEMEPGDDAAGPAMTQGSGAWPIRGELEPDAGQELGMGSRKGCGAACGKGCWQGKGGGMPCWGTRWW